MTLRSLFVLLAAVLCLAPAGAHDHVKEPVKVGDLEIHGSWARPRLGRAANSAAYFKIVNTGSADDRLNMATSDAAGAVELHEVIEDGDVMRMRPISGGIAIPAGETVALKPGGLHVMLLDLQAPFEAGDSFALTLDFETAGPVTLEVPVKPLREKAKDKDHHHH